MLHDVAKLEGKIMVDFVTWVKEFLLFFHSNEKYCKLCVYKEGNVARLEEKQLGLSSVCLSDAIKSNNIERKALTH